VGSSAVIRLAVTASCSAESSMSSVCGASGKGVAERATPVMFGGYTVPSSTLRLDRAASEGL
jgi:hypothetical protein